MGWESQQEVEQASMARTFSWATATSCSDHGPPGWPGSRGVARDGVESSSSSSMVLLAGQDSGAAQILIQ